jgi:Fur family peroxide stress response transcriptional regulator
MANKSIVKILVENKIRVTPQRIAALEAVLSLDFHPTAEDIVELLRINYPTISIGTVYKNLELFAEKEIIGKVKGSDETLRYDRIMEKHHHLIDSDTESIIDYFDADLNTILGNYFNKKKIPNFKIEDYKLQIIGHISEKEKTN